MFPLFVDTKCVRSVLHSMPVYTIPVPFVVTSLHPNLKYPIRCPFTISVSSHQWAVGYIESTDHLSSHYNEDDIDCLINYACLLIEDVSAGTTKRFHKHFVLYFGSSVRQLFFTMVGLAMLRSLSLHSRLIVFSNY